MRNTWIRWPASLALHAIVLGAIAYFCLRSRPGSKEIVIPISFEIIEEAAEASGPSAPPEEETSMPPAEEETSMPQAEEPAVERAGDWQEAPPYEESASQTGNAQNEHLREEPAPQPVEEAPAPPLESQMQTAGAEERAAVVSDPVALNKIEPEYPRSARRKGHEGSVTVSVSVDGSGRVSKAEVVSSSGYGELDDAALQAAGTTTFSPATEDGRAVDGRIRLAFEFKLKQ